MFTLIKNEKGAVLIIALMILVLLTMMSLTAILTTTTEMEIGANYKISQATFYSTEGGMDIAPGTIRRTIALKTESPSILTSLGIGITDTNGDGIDDNGISNADEDTTIFKKVNGASNDLTDDDNGNSTADFSEGIMGFTTSTPKFTITVNTRDVEVLTDRTGPAPLKGFSTGFASGYEGGAMTGRGISFSMTGTGTGDRHSQSQVQLQYLCIERSGGGCL